MSEDDDHMTVMHGKNSRRPRVDTDRQAKRATKAGNAMLVCSREIGDADLVNRAIELHRKALTLRPPGHPNRADSCANLGISLDMRYQQVGDVALIDEAIEFHREALFLRPSDHPDRAGSCIKLRASLYERYQEARDITLLDEAIELEREVLALRPPGHPDRATSCVNLGSSLHVRYRQLGDVALLDEAIEIKREALTLRPPGHSDRADICVNLAGSLYERYQQFGDVTLLDEAIELDREALVLRPPGHPNRAISCASLGSSLHSRSAQDGDISLLIEAIELKREALFLRPQGHPDRADSCMELGASLYNRYQEAGDITLLEEAIKLEREALALRPPGHPDRATSCANLGCSLYVRYQEVGDVTLIDEAIKFHREALFLRPPGHPDRASSCVNLATSLHMIYNQVGDVALLNEAIKLEREALAVMPPGHPDRATSCVNLGFSLGERYQQTGDVALLDEGIELEREALASQPPGHPDRGNTCINLGGSLHMRYSQVGDMALLNEAIELKREALTLHPPGHPDRSSSCGTLGSSLYVRYQQVGDVALLNETIELQREALALRPLGHPYRGESCGLLGSSLHLRYNQDGDVALLNEAIELKREALALHPPGHPNRVYCCLNLGSALHERYQQVGDLALLDETIELEREALALKPPGHQDQAHRSVNLASSLSAYYERTGNVVSLDEAMKVCSYALVHSPASEVWYPLIQLSALHLLRGSPYYSILKALEHLLQCFHNEVDKIHNFIAHVCSNAVRIWNDSSAWTRQIATLLVSVYAQVVDRLPLVAGFVIDTPSRLETLKSTRQVGSDACVAALLAEQPATAVTLLDRAHGVIWTQALHQRDPQMEGAPKDLAIELDNLLRAIATSTPVHPAGLPDHSQDLRHRQNTRIQAILREIRAMPGLSRFMLGSTYETLREAARNHPVVMLVAARDHAFALIIPSSSDASPDILRLHIASHDLRSLADSAGRANLRYRSGSTEHRYVEAFSQAIPQPELADQERVMRTGNFASDWSPLAILWRNVVKPVLMRLHLTKGKDMGRRPRLHWCTAGEFAHVPIHAAGIYTDQDQECCSDYVISSYTPTPSTLLRARKGLQPIRTTDAKLLLVAAEHTADTRLPALGKVKVETRDICSVVEKAGVRYAASSVSVSKTAQATAALPAANLVHIACHGLQHTSEPMKSAFHLSDHDVLSVSNLMKLDLKGAFLAFLSACETAKGDSVQPGQAIHLAATMLFVGFRSVVATMWAMRDEDGPVVSKAFYEKLFEGDTITADAIPYALDHAVRKLRESGAPVGSWATFIHVGA